MTIPDRLVQAAAEAMCIHRVPCEKHVEDARRALAAAFAALPECEEAKEALVKANLATVMFTAADGYPATSVRSNEGAAIRALAALAREFGEPTKHPVDRCGDPNCGGEW